MRVVDRYLALRAGAASGLILVLVLGLVMGVDLLMRMEELSRGNLPEGVSRAGLILRFGLYRLPAIASTLLPLAAVGGALIALAPMLRRNELVALAGAAVSLRAATRALLALALGFGALDLILADQLAPRLETTLSSLEEQLTGRGEQGRVWTVPETGSAWYAHHVSFGGRHGPELHQVVIAPRAGERLLSAERLAHDGEAWRLSQVREVVVDADPAERRFHPSLVCTGALALPADPAVLAQQLTSRHAMTGPQLLARGGRLNLALALGRWSRTLVPLLAVMAAIAVFARFEHREHLLVGAIKAFGAAAIPMVAVAGGGFVADASSLHPGLILGAAGLVAAALPLWCYARWQL